MKKIQTLFAALLLAMFSMNAWAVDVRETRTIAVDEATQAEAEGGTDNTKIMTPLRTKQAIDEFATSSLPTQTGNNGKLLTTDGSSPSWTSVTGGTLASQAEAEAGTENTKTMTALRTKQAINAISVIVSDNNNYTPTWSAATTNPTIGNGTIAGKWHRLGKWMDVDIDMVFGSTTTKGTGEWYFSLPSGYTIDTSYMAASAAGITVVGVVGANRSGSSLQVANVIYQDTGKFKAVSQGGTQYWSTTVPVTWASGDRFSIKAHVPISGW